MLAPLGQGVVRFLPTAINEGGFFDDTLEGSGVLRFPLRMVASKGVFLVGGGAGGARRGISFMQVC